LQRRRYPLLPDFAGSFPVKFGLVINPVPHDIVSVHSFWHIELVFQEFVPALLVELEVLIVAIIHAKDGVAYFSTIPKAQTEIAGVIARLAACIRRIKTTSMEDRVE
jgi:hypothetical protein